MSCWLVETLTGSTLLMLLVLALRAPVARAFGARWAYALWLLPALRLVLPPIPTLFPEAPLPPVVLFIPTTVRLAVPPPAELAASWEWMPFVAALWSGGAVIFLTLQWLAYREFLHRLSATARAARPPSQGGIAMLVSPEVEGPVALGLVRRKIVVPVDFLRRYSPVEQQLAIRHELIHHRRGDMWWNLAALVVLALHWFNPVAWLAFRAFRSDQELACDEAVAAGATLEERHDYASALVKSATRPGLIAACPLTHAGQLKHRLRMMRSHRVTTLRSLGGGAAIVSVAVASFAFATPGFDRPAERRVIYMAAPAKTVLHARSETPESGQRLALAISAPARDPLRRAYRHIARPAAPVQDSLALAAATLPTLPSPEPPRLAMFELRGLSSSRTRARRLVRVPARSSVSVYAAAMSAPPAELTDWERVDRLNALLEKLRDDHVTEADLKALHLLIDGLQGRVKVKVLHTIIGESEI